ncbi:phosphoribosyltransferase [Candidatus Roizmanbacteria bacterium]|nr:phosphoribosyltransferase [Candidatus Roizmanbacteria bacterium]
MINIISILKKTGAILTDDHFVLTSGRHSGTYINKDFLYPHVLETAKVGKMFADKMKTKSIDVVAAPAVGGTILCTWTAYYLSKFKKKEITSVYTEKSQGTFASATESEQIFRRGYDTFIKGKKVLVIEDLTTTGISVKKTADAVRKAGGTVVAVCVMVNRDSKHVNSKLMEAPFYSLGEFPAVSYAEESCPLCEKKVPINIKIGHGKKYLEVKKASLKQ